MKPCTIIGVDVSKLKLDSVMLPGAKSLQIANQNKGFIRWLTWLQEHSVHLAEVLIVMEDTGHYTYLFELFLQSHQIGYIKKPAVEIKRSAGLVRGKSDKVDAA